MVDAVKAAIIRGTQCEEKRDYAGAARHYEHALSSCGSGDHYLRGCLNINLGQMAERLRSPESAAARYMEAAAILRTGKGEAALQRGHALMNLGRILIDHDVPDAVGVFREAVQMYDAYPYTPVPDRMEARMALTVAEASFASDDEPIEMRAVLQVWHDVAQVASQDINRATVINFVSLLLALSQFGSIDLKAVEDWAGRALYREARALNGSA